VSYVGCKGKLAASGRVFTVIATFTPIEEFAIEFDDDHTCYRGKLFGEGVLAWLEVTPGAMKGEPNGH